MELDFFIKGRETLFGSEYSYQDSDYISFGVPYDLTSTYRIGSRYGPRAVREASGNIELNSVVNPFSSIENLKLHDLGDVIFCYRLSRMLRRVYNVVRLIISSGKTPIMLGGEHTFTLPAILAILRRTQKVTLVILDAHFDLRSEYLDLKICHATYLYHLLRRAKSRGWEIEVAVIGVRAYDKEELDNVESFGVEYFTAPNVVREREDIRKRINELTEDKMVYLSVDVDVLDPAYAPGVGNPEPLGLSLLDALEVINSISPSASLAGLDVMEVSPLYDKGESSLAAARLLAEVLALFSMRRVKA
ncbi:MAG TPA: agmatinase [Candidatus Caldiarchaeum subterraneum]|uniref:Agmatinase n=1 Tax=Caldiarchaeum subterraneum TaxID=311458 RepID=A0A833EAA7_CALS0|nr:agmatinase [Candidatus Caldarchaeum subterraneum]